MRGRLLIDGRGDDPKASVVGALAIAWQLRPRVVEHAPDAGADDDPAAPPAAPRRRRASP